METGKTILDRAAAFAGLVLLSPVLLVTAVLVWSEDRRPVFFRQTRVGRGGRRFELLKFRSMRVSSAGPRITADSDNRVTRVGRLLRKYKLDELPQLWNVLRGEMSLVGPRPEVPAFVELEDPAWQAVLSVRPGITDLASLVYRNEESLFPRGEDPERYYREVILPAKLRLNLDYLATRSLWSDLKLIVLTVRYSFFPAGFDVARIRRIFACPENV